MEIGHLGPEAIAALVDGELSPRAAERARIHLVNCADCRREVLSQREVAQAMRTAMAQQDSPGHATENEGQGLPAALLSRLAAIPEDSVDPQAAARNGQNTRAAGVAAVGDRGRAGARSGGDSAEQKLNFDIAGRRFPRTLAAKIELFIHQLRDARRS